MKLGNARLAHMVEQLWVQIMALVGLVVLRFHGNAMRIAPGVLADAGDLPGDVNVGLVRLDRKGVVVNLRSNGCLVTVPKTKFSSCRLPT